jgi:hypothetical protein
MLSNQPKCMDRVLSAEIANPTGPRIYTQDEVHQSANYRLLWKEMNALQCLYDGRMGSGIYVTFNLRGDSDLHIVNSTN